MVMMNQFMRDFLQSLALEKKWPIAKQILVAKKKCPEGVTVDFNFIKSDTSPNESVSHKLLQNLISDNKAPLTPW